MFFDFGWCASVCFRNFGSFPKNKEKLGRILGPCKNEVNEMSQSIVVSSVHAITHRTFRSLRISELHSKTERRKRRIFDSVIQKKLGDYATIPTSPNSLEHVP